MNTRSNKYKNITFDIIFYLAVGILAIKNYNNRELANYYCERYLGIR